MLVQPKAAAAGGSRVSSLAEGTPRLASPVVAPARVVQRSEREKPAFGALVAKRFPDAKVLVMVNSYDVDRDSIGETSVGFYKSQTLGVVNSLVTWNVDTRKIEKPKSGAHLITGDLILVVTGHGNVHWLFSKEPASEKKAVIAFGQALLVFQQKYQCNFVGIILDACSSATEVSKSLTKLTAPCPARLLSSRLAIPVLGFNGKVSSGKVSYYTEHDETPVKASYADNCVIFENGVITRKSVLKDHTEIWHSTENMGNAYYRKQLFTTLVDVSYYKSDLG